MKGRNAILAGLLLCCVPFLFACRTSQDPVDIIPVITASPVPPAAPTPVPVSPVVLNMETGSVYGGGVIQLAAYENPSGRELESASVRWTSSETSVAVVESYGVVIGLSEGTAVITAETPAGDTASCTVAVTSDRPKPRQTVRLTTTDCRRGKQKLEPAEVRRVQSLADALLPETAGERIALSALRYVGNYYGVKEGNIDCSMLLLYACLDNGGFLPRRSDWQAKALEARAVDRADLRAGDVLFFAYEAGDPCSCKTAPLCTRHLGVHHAAVYLGERSGVHYLVEASSVVGRVCVRAWDGGEQHAGLRLVLIARPDDGTVYSETIAEGTE